MARTAGQDHEMRVALFNASMGITDNQFCLILLHTLPDSYEGYAYHILASGSPDHSNPSQILAGFYMGRSEIWIRIITHAATAPIKSQKANNEITPISRATT